MTKFFTRALPTENGEYWYAEDHWCDGDPVYTRVYRNNDGVLMCLPFGQVEAIPVVQMAWPAYWKKVRKPKAVFARFVSAHAT